MKKKLNFFQEDVPFCSNRLLQRDDKVGEKGLLFQNKKAETADIFRAAATPVPASLSHPITFIYFRDFRDTRLVISSQIKPHFGTTLKRSKS